MASLVSKTETISMKSKKLAGGEGEEEGEGEGEEVEINQNKPVTSHLYLKPAHSSQSLDKEEVLRRIRQRKRVNMVRTALQSVLRLPSSSPSKPNKVSVPQRRWVDDAFAAL
ncbi:hypothetical protein PanWU01x14_083290 [Parasponia andersonii]|uniref:Uncharacterized protein n=1 Tax=Parasponia andersonii TaxID=3476 RepID=A0A2P5DA34_PARAD|nr:hypothetical protein PanWU01x14_083290 [Parasponia andersonii]